MQHRHDGQLLTIDWYRWVFPVLNRLTRTYIDVQSEIAQRVGSREDEAEETLGTTSVFRGSKVWLKQYYLGIAIPLDTNSDRPT